jgi:two-component system heavy metal sensor histidine kinase CusS
VRALLVSVPRRTDARLFVGVPRTNLEADALYLRRTLAMALALAVGMATLVTSLLVRRLTRQHEAIAQTAHRVADGDLGARVDTLSNDTDVIELTRDVNHMIARVETLVTSQRRFVSHAAHELRSPLTALYGELQLAGRKERTAEEYRAAIAEALVASRRLKLLTEELLVLARLGTQAQASSADVVLQEVVDDAVAQIAQEAEEKRVAVAVLAEPVTVRGRRGDLVRLVRNLVENAVAHSDPGMTVTITVREDGAADAEVRVADEGAGVLEADRERIFEPFYRAADDRGREGPGAGLGLAIAREIARTHAGDLRLAADVARGAVFVARLPRAPAPGEIPGTA